MSFSEFTLRSALQSFGLTVERDKRLFPNLKPVAPGPMLQYWLTEFAPIAVASSSEAARSAYIITPFLAEVSHRSTTIFKVFPGATLDVDKSRGLNGNCDYLISRSPEYLYITGPLAAVVEAKREDIVSGLGQCLASLVAIREFNERDGTPVNEVYGVVTSGTNWRFLKLERSVVSVDHDEYYLNDPAMILGALFQIAGGGVRE